VAGIGTGGVDASRTVHGVTAVGVGADIKLRDQNSIEARGSALTGAPFHLVLSGSSPSIAPAHFVVEGTATIELGAVHKY
jgi:hypothetical protein